MQFTTIFLYAVAFFYQVTMIRTQLVDIVQTAINANFTTLTTALQAADLVTALKGTGPFTVFAPTDAAFGKLSTGTLQDLLKPENKAKLSRILQYHVIGDRKLTAAQILAMTLPTTVKMLQGDTVKVSKNGNNVNVNDATVIQTDVMATNGIIHVIDTVLMPPAPSSAAYLYANQLFLFIVLSAILSSFF